MECIGLRKKLRTKFPGLIRKIGADGYMNPEDCRTGNYLAQICREISNRYNVDGIHLDYIRYPETWNIKVSREQGRRIYNQYRTKDQRRSQITETLDQDELFTCG